MKDANTAGTTAGRDLRAPPHIHTHPVTLTHKRSFAFVHCKVLSGFQVICSYPYGSMKVESNGNRMESYARFVFNWKL